MMPALMPLVAGLLSTFVAFGLILPGVVRLWTTLTLRAAAGLAR